MSDQLRPRLSLVSASTSQGTPNLQEERVSGLAPSLRHSVPSTPPRASCQPRLKTSPMKRPKPKPKFTKQQIRAAHQILYHGETLATQTCIQLQHAMEGAGPNDAVMIHYYKDMESDPGSMTPMITMDEPSGTRLCEERRQLLQNNTLYATYDYVRDITSKQGLTSMWRGDHSYARFDVIKNRPHTSDKRPRGAMQNCRGQKDSIHFLGDDEVTIRTGCSDEVIQEARNDMRKWPGIWRRMMLQRVSRKSNMPVSDDEDDEEDAFAETVVDPSQLTKGTALQITATSKSRTEVTATAQGLSVSATLQPGNGQTDQPHVVISTQYMPQTPVQSMRMPDDSFLTRDAALINDTATSFANTLASIPEMDVTLGAQMQQDMQRLKDQDNDSDDGTGAVFKSPAVKISTTVARPSGLSLTGGTPPPLSGSQQTPDENQPQVISGAQSNAVASTTTRDTLGTSQAQNLNDPEAQIFDDMMELGDAATLGGVVTTGTNRRRISMAG